MFILKNEQSILSKSTQYGFTLMELLITIIIMGIIATIAVPSFKIVIANSKVRNAVTTIQSTLEQARAESFVTKKPILVKVEGSLIYTESQDAMNNKVIHTQEFNDVQVAMQSNISNGVRFYGRMVQDGLGGALKNDNTGFTVCHPNSSLKVTVSVNPNSSITVSEIGVCP